MIAHDPLHRSGRAALPHPAPTLGDDAQAHEGIRMTDTSRRKPPSRSGGACGATAGDSPGCDGATTAAKATTTA